MKNAKFSKKKLSPQSITLLQKIIADISYTCGATFDDIMPDELCSVCIRVHKCFDPVERLYYSCFCESICINCCTEVLTDNNQENYYPQCSECCKAKAPTRRPKKNKT